MKTWVSPIFKRKDGKRESLLSGEDQHDQMEKYYSCIRESGLKIHALVQVITSPTDTQPRVPGTHHEVCLVPEGIWKLEQ